MREADPGRLSAVMLAPDDGPGFRRLLAALAAQTIRDRLELVLVTPPSGPAIPDDLADSFAAVRRVTVDRLDSITVARVAGVHAATTPLVVFTEDHSYPGPRWAEALVRALDDAAVAGPTMVNANPGGVVSWANFLIEYGPWAYPIAGGDVDHLPGHNSAYRRAELLHRGSGLAGWLESESVFHWHLRAGGCRVRLDPAARTAHLNFSRFLPSFPLRFAGGRLFAACRARGWSRLRRLAWAAGSPLIPLVRLIRTVRHARRVRPPISPWRLPAVVLPLLVADAAGEMVGYATGAGQAMARITRLDFHRERFLDRRDLERLGEGVPGARGDR